MDQARQSRMGLVERAQVDGVDFKPGVNTETYKYYIDFAAKYGIEYIILDEGWYKLGNVLKSSPRSTCRS